MPNTSTQGAEVDLWEFKANKDSQSCYANPVSKKNDIDIMSEINLFCPVISANIHVLWKAEEPSRFFYLCFHFFFHKLNPPLSSIFLYLSSISLSSSINPSSIHHPPIIYHLSPSFSLSVDQAVLRFTVTLLPQPLKCWDCRCVSPHSTFSTPQPASSHWGFSLPVPA